MEKTTILMTFAFAMLALGAAVVLADVTAPTGLTRVGSSTRDLSGLGAQTAPAQGGNVTALNIEALTITTSWQGYFGNVSGEITLDDAAGNTFYNWSVATVQGEIFATRVSSITWSDVNCTNATNITTEETYLGQTAADGDSVTNTYALTTHPAFDVGTSQIYVDTCPSTNAFANSDAQTANWTQVLLYGHTEQAVVYSTIMNDSTIGFDGGTHDFQLLVGENEKTGNIGATTYYFWVELE